MGTILILRNHLFIPAEDHADVDAMDVDAMLHHIHRILVEGFDNLVDNVVVALDQQHHRSVSVIFNNKWMCRIDLNDNIAQLLLDYENWVHQATETDLTDEDRSNIVAAFPRLDLLCAPDEEHEFDDEFDAICLYLQLNFRVKYSYDPVQGIFTVHDI